MNSMILRKGMLSIAGLAFAGGVFAGPMAEAHAAPVESKAVAVAVQADKADKGGKLLPHGVQGKQSRIDLNAEQTGNVKAIIAATKKADMDERAAV
ncbi:hypothetical protein V6U80_15735, partial [Micromonospora sp. CPCC 205543]